MGLEDDWLNRLERSNPERRRALSVTRLVAGTPAARQLRNGDIILAVDGEVVTSYRSLEKAVQKPAVTLTVWRDDAAVDIALETAALSGRGVERVVSWAGALLQDPHRAMQVRCDFTKPGRAELCNGKLGLPAGTEWTPPLHPSMLYEALLEGFVLFAILWWFSSHPRPRMSQTA